MSSMQLSEMIDEFEDAGASLDSLRYIVLYLVECKKMVFANYPIKYEKYRIGFFDAVGLFWHGAEGRVLFK